jgi:uncharacterized protein YodC (DUF2158 family)
MENEIKFELGDIVYHKADLKKKLVMTIHKISHGELMCKYFNDTTMKFELSMFYKSELIKIG